MGPRNSGESEKPLFGPVDYNPRVESQNKRPSAHFDPNGTGRSAWASTLADLPPQHSSRTERLKSVCFAGPHEPNILEKDPRKSTSFSVPPPQEPASVATARSSTARVSFATGKRQPIVAEVVPLKAHRTHQADEVSTSETSSRSSTEVAIKSSITHNRTRPGRYFKTRRVDRKDIQKPWLEAKRKELEWCNIMPICAFIAGFLLAGACAYLGYASVSKHKYCQVLDDNFDSPTLDTSIWSTEVQLGGFGNGEFEVTTNAGENVYIQNGQLIIKPTLQDPLLLTNGSVLNLTAQGICTSDLSANCVAATNTTNGTIINPVKSGRINTMRSVSIKYGKVEVSAKMPVGDWLWPAIWMLPVDNVYGAWPQSGEIDILESRGNNYEYADGGNNYMTSSLHWGPNQHQDGYYKTYSKRKINRTTYTKAFHTYGLEWSEKYLFTYVDSQLRQVLYTPFDIPFWTRGNFPNVAGGNVLVNPWSQTGNDSTPFDQEFYLILNVAVGGTNGFFADDVGNKPWPNNAVNASTYFWQAKDQWYPTWVDGEAQMTVESVKMWQQCD